MHTEMGACIQAGVRAQMLVVTLVTLVVVALVVVGWGVVGGTEDGSMIGSGRRRGFVLCSFRLGCCRRSGACILCCAIWTRMVIAGETGKRTGFVIDGSCDSFVDPDWTARSRPGCGRGACFAVMLTFSGA